MCDVAPGIHPIPRILSETIGLSKEEAARKVAAMRQPTSSAEWFAIRKKDREEKERAAKLATGEGVIDVAAEAEDFAAKAIALDQITRAAAEPVAPCEVTKEQLRQARERKAKMAKATRSKVAADAKDKAAAKAHADKVLRRMEQRGQL